MKKINKISIVVCFLTVLVWLYSIVISKLPDTVIRINGVIMLVAIFMTSFSTASCMKRKK